MGISLGSVKGVAHFVKLNKSLNFMNNSVMITLDIAKKSYLIKGLCFSRPLSPAVRCGGSLEPAEITDIVSNNHPLAGHLSNPDDSVNDQADLLFARQVQESFVIGMQFELNYPTQKLDVSVNSVRDKWNPRSLAAKKPRMYYDKGIFS